MQDDAQVLHRSDAEVRRTVRTLRQLGADWLRVTANWSFIAPRPESARPPDFDAADPDAYPPGAWAKLDRAVGEARAAGLRVMIDVGFWAPRWAVREPSSPPDRQRRDIDAAAFGRFAEAVARRYRDRAVGFTVWNEPNYWVFLLPQWRPRPGGGWEVASADEYREMLYAAEPAIRRAAPGALVLVGATAASGADGPGREADGVAPLRFLRALACTDDALRPVRTGACAGFRPLPGDGWAHHPYSPRVPPDRSDPRPDTANVADTGRLQQLLDRLHGAGRTRERMDVWVTEYGYETNPPDPRQEVTPRQQARWIAEAEEIALSSPRVRSWAQFLFRDLPDPGDFQSGLEFPDGAPKPAMAAFAYPLVVRRAGPGRIAVWGRARAGRGERRVRVTAAGRPLRESTTADDGTFAFTAAADPGAVFGFQVRRGERWVAVGVPVAGAS